MITDLKVRPAGVADAEQIASLHADSWRRTYRGAFRDEFLDGDIAQDRLAVWSGRLTSPPANQYVLVAEEEGIVHGFLCAYGGHDATWGSLVDNLHVGHGARRQGIGTALIRSVAVWAQSNYRQCSLYLWVLEQNDGARRFYERLGASNRGLEVLENPGGGVANNLRYVWEDLGRLASTARGAERP